MYDLTLKRRACRPQCKPVGLSLTLRTARCAALCAFGTHTYASDSRMECCRAPQCPDGKGHCLRGRPGRARRLRQRLRPPVPVEQGMFLLSHYAQCPMTQQCQKRVRACCHLEGNVPGLPLRKKACSACPEARHLWLSYTVARKRVGCEGYQLSNRPVVHEHNCTTRHDTTHNARRHV